MRSLRPLASAVVLIGIGALPLSADASLSVELTLDGLAARADAVAVFVPLERHAFWEGGRIYTEWRLRVDELVAGAVERGDEVTIRTRGGVVGAIGQWVGGEPRLGLGERTLLFVRHAESSLFVVGRAQGEYRLLPASDREEHLTPIDAGELVPARDKSVTETPARATLAGRLLPEIAPAIASSWRRAHEG